MVKYSLRHPSLGDSFFGSQFFDTPEAAVEFAVRALALHKDTVPFTLVSWTDTEIKTGTVVPVQTTLQDIIKP